MSHDFAERNKAETRHGKLSIVEKLAYSVGAFSDSVPFNIFYYYFLYFLTDVVGVDPAVGGTISLIAIMWDAVTDPVVGHLSDNCRSKYGRRRPFMIGASLPIYIFTILLFTTTGETATQQFVYYLFAAIGFWTAYKFYVIPFLSMSAEITDDFNERSTIKTYTGIIMYTATWLVTAGPMFVVDKVTKSGGEEKTAWFLSASVFGLVALAGALICWNFTRGKERVSYDANIVKNAREKTRGDVVKDYVALIKMKPFRNIALYIFFTCVNYSIASAAFVFLMSNNLGLSADKQAIYWTTYTVICFAMLPVCNFLATRMGKKLVTIVLCLITIAGCLFFAAFGIQTYHQLLIYTVIYNISNVCFWTIGYAMVNDCCEVFEYISGERREGSINGIASFAQKFGSAIGMWLSGILLSLVGYHAELEEQSDSALNGILQLNTLIPAIAIAISVIFVILYPITEKRYRSLMEALQARGRGESYSDENLKKLF